MHFCCPAGLLFFFPNVRFCVPNVRYPTYAYTDLRHYSASVQHAIGIPDAYIMQRGGWGNDGVLKDVYRHVMNDREREMNQKANLYFENLCNTTCNTENKNP